VKCSPSEPTGRPAVPPPQRNYEEAASRALAGVRRQPADQLEWLGALGAADQWRVPVLDGSLTVEQELGTVRDSTGRPVGPLWRVLTLHYLGVPARPKEEPPAITFADLPGGRAYAGVYQGRVIHRLCRTVGRDRKTLRRAAETLGGQVIADASEGPSSAPAAPVGDLVLEFQVYPRVRLRLVWYAGDEELSPSAVLLLPGNIESFFCLEDIVVLSEGLISRLSGGRF